MRFAWIILLSLTMAGCASSPVYNPMQDTSPAEILLNQSGFKAVQEGQTLDQVHSIMGQELIIGYESQTPGYKPLTIPNPYKSEAIKGTSYIIEYYIEAIRQPDGIVSDNDLMPLIFKDNKLIGRGWPLANSLSPRQVLDMKAFYISLKPFLNHGALNRPTEWGAMFANDHPLEVEIGFGNGEYLERLSRQDPRVNFIGFEQYCERIHRTLRKLSRTGLDNVRVLRLDARAGFERYISPRTISRVHCLYPPPWPKKSDIKHRLFTEDFLKLVNSRLVDGGVLKIVTDHYPYIDWVRENISGSGFSVEFKNIEANYGTKFEKKWVEGGQSEFYELLLTKHTHIPVGIKEDSTLQSYLIENLDPDNFSFKDYSHEGVAVSFKEILYDAKRKVALVHVIACDGPLVQNIRIVIAHGPQGWRVNLAEGTMLMPTMAVSQALECVYQAAKN